MTKSNKYLAPMKHTRSATPAVRMSRNIKVFSKQRSPLHFPLTKSPLWLARF